MVNKSEIRLGNWFNHNANWCYRSPTEIKPFDFKWEDRDWYAVGESTMSLEDCSPIPLTEDILLKCGFHADNYGIFELVRDNAPYKSGCDILLWCKKILKEGEAYYWDFSVGNNLGTLIHVCKDNHLHHIQNLVFYLSGMELGVNL